MRYLPGWAVGALSTAAIVAAFFAGGVFGAPKLTSLSAAAAPPAIAEPAPSVDAQGLEVSCEPGQRAVVRQASLASAGSVACVTAAAEPLQTFVFAPAAAPASVVRVADFSARPYATPAVINEPIEVYRPRSVPARSSTRDGVRPTRSVKKSVAIIAGSTAAGAVVGGLAKGKKGALIGGIVGGGAATVWDQVTRRRTDEVR